MKRTAIEYTDVIDKLGHDYHSVVNNAIDPIVIMNSEGKVTEFNLAAEKVFGYQRDEILNQDMAEYLIPNQYRDMHRKGLERYMKTKQSKILGKRIQIEALQKGGDSFPIELIIVPIEWEDHDIKFSAMIRDLSAFKERESELATIRLQMERTAIEYTQLIETANAPIFGIDTDGNINEWNRGVAKLTGYSKESVIGQNLVDKHITEEHQASVKQILADALEGKETTSYEVPLFTQHGDRIMLLLNATTRRNAEGKITGVVGVGQDITEIDRSRSQMLRTSKDLVIAKDQAEKASQAKGFFLANVSHEIRTPMNAIIGAAEIMSSKALSLEQKDLCKVMTQSGETLLALIDEVLDLSRFDAVGVELRNRPFRIRDVIDQTIRTLDQEKDIKNLIFTHIVSTTVPEYLEGDKHRLQQVLLNLVGNSIKFTTTGSINVSIYLKEPLKNNRAKICIEVTDTGVGMNTQIQQQIFEAFNQGDLSISRRFKGVGLGLTISSRIIAAMKGNIHVKSKPGVGSTFYVNIELAKVDKPKEEQERLDPEALPYRNPKLRLLLVDDVEVNRNIGEILLQKWGYTVSGCATGQEAIDAFVDHKCDLILMDIQMPQMDGIEATAKIRELEQDTDTHLPIIAMTAHAMVDDREKFLNAGLDGYVSKPLRQNKLELELAAIKQLGLFDNIEAEIGETRRFSEAERKRGGSVSGS
jgi:PAS domain S-box-containing protein